jgi:alkanesulfonate monooxygenase SsuD/methylene tetrahydromethanopterin reductase-like flavin-dependent oxidoreductase (luciferase family)
LARERIDEGRASAGRTDPHRVIVFVKGRIDAGRDHAREVVAHMLLDESLAAQLEPLDRGSEIAELRALGDPGMVASRLPEDLLDELTATGTPEQVAASLAAIAETGVDAIAFAPIGPDPDEQLRLLADRIAPEFRD